MLLLSKRMILQLEESDLNYNKSKVTSKRENTYLTILVYYYKLSNEK